MLAAYFKILEGQRHHVDKGQRERIPNSSALSPQSLM